MNNIATLIGHLEPFVSSLLPLLCLTLLLFLLPCPPYFLDPSVPELSHSPHLAWGLDGKKPLPPSLSNSSVSISCFTSGQETPCQAKAVCTSHHSSSCGGMPAPMARRGFETPGLAPGLSCSHTIPSQKSLEAILYSGLLVLILLIIPCFSFLAAATKGVHHTARLSIVQWRFGLCPCHSQTLVCLLANMCISLPLLSLSANTLMIFMIIWKNKSLSNEGTWSWPAPTCLA
jgi:hypothetical protein